MTESADFTRFKRLMRLYIGHDSREHACSHSYVYDAWDLPLNIRGNPYLGKRIHRQLYIKLMAEEMENNAILGFPQ